MTIRAVQSRETLARMRHKYEVVIGQIGTAFAELSIVEVISMRRRLGFAAVCTIALLLAEYSCVQAQHYQIHILDMPEGHAYSIAKKINDNGMVVGLSAMDVQGGYMPEVYFWEATGVHRTGIDPGAYRTVGVNNTGTIIGGNYVLSSGTLSTLPTVGSIMGNVLRDINDAGVVVGGSSYDDQGHQRAAYWDSFGAHAIGTDLTSWATAINNTGQIVGLRYAAPNSPTGFIWDSGQMTDIGFLDDYISSSTSDINILGQVVGSCSNSESFGSGHFTKAYLWQNGHTTDLLG
jgi:probable HAF family extracellular repeat protein